jgi:hypothetical protein
MQASDVLIWAGSLITLAGVVGLAGVVLFVIRQRRAGLDDAALRKALQRGVLWNMAALFCSVIGLMLVVVGISFG